MRRLPTIAASLGLAAVATLAFAQDMSPEERAIEIRHGHMQNNAANIGVLGGMAQGDAEYNSAAAQTAADNLFHLASIAWGHYWPEGTSSEDNEESRALPAIWENMEDFEAKRVALLDAVTALQGSAGTDLASLQAGIGAVGQACGACHETYRAPSE